jgi:hypothetical protein
MLLIPFTQKDWREAVICMCRLALQAFIALLDVPMEEAYECPVCRKGQHCDYVVVADGTTVGYRKESAKEYVPASAPAGTAKVADHMCVLPMKSNGAPDWQNYATQN